MRDIKRTNRLTIAALALLLVSTTAYGPCSTKQQPLTVADVLTRAGNVKRDLRERERQVPGSGISAQTDYDISERLLAANRAYRRFIDDELARLAAGGTQPDPSARRAAVNALITSLRGLQDPSVLGIKSANGQKLWREAVTTLGTIIAGLEAVQGGE